MPPVSPAVTTTTSSSLTRVKVVGAKSSKQAIARYRLLDLDADDDDDDDTDDDDAGGDDTDMASFVARDDDEIDVDSNGSHPGILGLGLYRRAMLSSSHSSLSAATAVSRAALLWATLEFEDATL